MGDYGKMTELLRSTIHGRIGRQHQARFGTSDVVQECAVQLIHEFEKLAPEDAAPPIKKSWLSKIGFGNTARLKKRDRAQCRSVERESSGACDFPSHQATPDEIAASEEIANRLVVALSTLNSLESEIINRHYRLQQSLNSIATDLGLSSKKIQRSHRAIIQKLKKELTRSRNPQFKDAQE